MTPTTKDDDTEINETDRKTGLVRRVYQLMKEKALALFSFGSSYLLERGIVLVDTKYEFGILDGELILIDEMHTPDSSRFWSKEDYDKNPSTAEQIDKEFVRQWMLANKVNGEVPTVLSEEVVVETSKRYREIYKIVTGTPYQLPTISSRERMLKNLCANNLMLSSVIHIVCTVDVDDSFLASLQNECKQKGIATNVLRLGVSTLSDLTAYKDSLDQAKVLTLDTPDEINANLSSLGMPIVSSSTSEELAVIIERLK